MIELLKTSEVADILRLKPATVRGMCESGKLPGARFIGGGVGNWRINKDLFFA